MSFGSRVWIEALNQIQYRCGEGEVCIGYRMGSGAGMLLTCQGRVGVGLSFLNSIHDHNKNQVLLRVRMRIVFLN